MTNFCKVEGCDRLLVACGMCNKHYRRFKKHGDVNRLDNVPNKKIEYEIDENDCFNCTSHAISRKGYPIIHQATMGRFVYTEMFGEIPDGHVIRHKCDNRRCINPEHLITGTPKENSQDMLERDRSARGSRHKLAKLTEEQVLEIKRLLRDTNLKHHEIAELFSITRSMITQINIGAYWKHVKL